MFSTFYHEPFNWYWFGALILSVIIPAIAVVLTHAQQFRQHKVARLWGDVLIREQMGFFSFSTALFVSAYFQSDSKVLGIEIGILGALGALFFALGLWLTGQAHLSEAFQKDLHTCDVDSTKPCTHSLGRRVQLQLVLFPLLLFLVTFGLATALAFSVHQAGDESAGSKRVPVALGIASDQVDGQAYRSTPIFIQDNLDKLDEERRAAKSRDYVVAVLESESLSSYGRFCWAVSLRPDFQTNFALSARSAYLLHPPPQVSVTNLTFRGIGAPFKTIVSEAPNSKDGDKIVLVVAVYARSSKPLLHDLMVMLETRVDCL